MDSVRYRVTRNGGDIAEALVYYIRVVFHGESASGTYIVVGVSNDIGLTFFLGPPRRSLQFHVSQASLYARLVRATSGLTHEAS